jgi:aspartate aminotransferase
MVLNQNVRGLRPSATLAINERCEVLRREGRRIYKLGLGQSPFPVPLPVVEALKANAFQKDYLAVKGLRQLRESVANYQRRVNGIPCTAEDVLVGPGSKELMFLVQLVYYGDLVIPTPSWVSYAPQAHIIGRRVTWVETKRENGWRLMPDELEAHCQEDPDRPRIVILNYPNNPTGLTYSEGELKALAKVAQSHSMVLLSDEIYGELNFQAAHQSIARYHPEGTIISSGLSKWCGAGGWRLGLFVFPQKLRRLLDAMASVASETYTSTSAPIQYAAVRAFEGGSEIEEYLKQARRILYSLGQYCTNSLHESGACVNEPQGGFYLFPDFSSYSDKLHSLGIHTNVEMCERLLEDTGVAMLPGLVFGRPEQEFTARIAFVDFDGGHCLAAAAQVPYSEPLSEEFLRARCPNLINAMDVIRQWLS